MSLIVSTEELIEMDRSYSPAAKPRLASVGDEFAWDDLAGAIDLSDLECQPLLASDLPLNSELQAM